MCKTIATLMPRVTVYGVVLLAVIGGATTQVLRAGERPDEGPEEARLISDQDLKEAAAHIRAEHVGGKRMWEALAALVRPGMTVAQMKAVLPPAPAEAGGVSPEIVLFDGQSFFITYALDAEFGVEASGTAKGKGAEQMVLAAPPRIKTLKDIPHIAVRTKDAAAGADLPNWAQAAARALPGFEVVHCDREASVQVGPRRGFRMVLRKAEPGWDGSANQAQGATAATSETEKRNNSPQLATHVELVVFPAAADLPERLAEQIPWQELSQTWHVQAVDMGQGMGFRWFARTTLYWQEWLREKLKLKGGDDRLALLAEGLYVDEQGSSTANSVMGPLKQAGEKAVPYIEAAMKRHADDDPWKAAHAVGYIQGDRATALLKSLYASDNDRLSQAAAYALINEPYRKAAREEYFDLLRRQKDVYQAAAACVEFQWREAIPLLQAVCDKPAHWGYYRDALKARRTLENRPIARAIEDAEAAIVGTAHRPLPTDEQTIAQAKKVLLDSSDTEAVRIAAIALAIFDTKANKQQVQRVQQAGREILKKLPADDTKKLLRTLVDGMKAHGQDEGYWRECAALLEWLGSDSESTIGAWGTEQTWGEPVEGVQVALHAEKIHWQTGEIPKFTTETRKGERKIVFGWGDAICELEFDGRWYSLAIDDHPVDRISLDDPWKDKETNAKLPLSPGKHTIRVAIIGPVDGKSVRAVSNRVEFVIERALPGSTRAIEHEMARSEFAFAAVCEAAGSGTVVQVTDDGGTAPHPVYETVQEYNVREVLAGKTLPEGAVKLQYSRQDAERCRERAVTKGECVIWLVCRFDHIEGKWYGVKAIADTPENRKAIAAAESVQGEAVNGLKCSIGVQENSLRVGDEIRIDAKFENVSDKPISFPYPPDYAARLMLMRDEKGQAVESRMEIAKSGGSHEETSHACSRLADLGRPEVVPVLIERAKSGAPMVQRGAIGQIDQMLEFHAKKLPGQAIVGLKDELIGILKRDRDGSVRSRAATALAKARGEDVAPALLEALEDPDAFVGSYAAHSLGRTAGPEAIPALEAYSQTAPRENQKRAAQEAIERIRERAKAASQPARQPSTGSPAQPDAAVAAPDAKAAGEDGQPSEKGPATFQEILAMRPTPELDRLAERSKPDYEVPDATESFYDVLKLREVGKADAVPVLEQIVADNLESGRIHGFAAAQALFCIGTREAHQVLSKHLLTGQYRAGQAIGYTFHWEMAEPQRSRFIEQYLLKNVSEDLVVELQQRASPEKDKGRLDLLVTLRNDSDRPFHVMDRKVYLGKMLFFRTPDGKAARSGAITRFYHGRNAGGGVKYHRGPDEWIELKPGQTHQYVITVHVKPAAEIRPRDRSVSKDSTVLLETQDVRWDIGKPGRYEVLAMFEAMPLTETQRKQVSFDNTWSGRAVSKPVQVDIPEPVTHSPAKADEASQGGRTVEANRQRAEQPASGKTAAATDGVFPDIRNLQKAGDTQAVLDLERILADAHGDRFRRSAAARALFSIGTPEAHQVMAEYLLPRRHHLGLTVNYFNPSGWEMPEPERSRFIEQYLLWNVSQNLVVELEVGKPTNVDGEQLDFVVTLRNASDKPFHIEDPQIYLGRLLYFRDASGRFARSMKYAEVHTPKPKWIELKSGQTRRLEICAQVKPFDETTQDPRGAPESVAVLETRDIRYYLEATERFQVVAMFEAAPLTEAERNQVRFDNAWSGRAVSKPIEVTIPEPTPTTTDPTEDARSLSPPWSKQLKGLRVRVTAPPNAEYRKGQPLPLTVEMQNVTEEPVPYHGLSPHGRIHVTDAQGEWLGVPWFETAVSPWEGRSDSLAPQAILKWQVRFDRLRFTKPVTPGSTVHFQYSVPGQVEEPGRLPRTSFSPPVAIKLIDVPPAPLEPEDLPQRWTTDMDLVYREFAGLGGPERRVHVDGQGHVTLVDCAGFGRIETVLPQERLDRLAVRLRHMEIWELSKLTPHPGPLDAGEIRFSLTSGGASLVGFYSLLLTGKEPVLAALQQEMKALIDEALAAAETERKAEAGLLWGEAVEGVQSRLKTDETVYKADEIPTFRVDARNNGPHQCSLYRSAELYDLLVDGLRYRWTRVIDRQSQFYVPGTGVENVSIRAGGDLWARDKPPYDRLLLTPGKHTFQVEFETDLLRSGTTASARVLSNPLEIEVVSGEEDRPPAQKAWSTTPENRKAIGDESEAPSSARPTSEVEAAETDVPEHLRHWPGLSDRVGDKIVNAPPEDAVEAAPRAQDNRRELSLSDAHRIFVAFVHQAKQKVERSELPRAEMSPPQAGDVFVQGFGWIKPYVLTYCLGLKPVEWKPETSSGRLLLEGAARPQNVTGEYDARWDTNRWVAEMERKDGKWRVRSVLALVGKPVLPEDGRGGRQPTLPGDAAAQWHNVGSQTSIQEAVNRWSAFAVACEATEASRAAEFAHLVPRSTFKVQQYRTLEVLEAKAVAPRGFPHLVYRVWNEPQRRERPVGKGERVIWIGINPAPDQYRGVKALPDTPENREAVRAAFAKRPASADKYVAFPERADAEEAARRIALLKRNLDTFRLVFRAMLQPDTPAKFLALRVAEGEDSSGWEKPAVRITRQQAARIIDHLAAEGLFFRRAGNVIKDAAFEPETAVDTLWLIDDEKDSQTVLVEELQYGDTRRLSALRNVLKGEARAAADKLLARLVSNGQQEDEGDDSPKQQNALPDSSRAPLSEEIERLRTSPSPLKLVASNVKYEGEALPKPPDDVTGEKIVDNNVAYYRSVRARGLVAEDLTANTARAYRMFDLAVAAGWYERKGSEYLPQDIRGLYRQGAGLWMGSNGAGILVYDTKAKTWSRYSIQQRPVPGFNVTVLYGDADYVFANYGYSQEVPNASPSLHVYSTTHRAWLRIIAIPRRDALRLGTSEGLRVAGGWNHRRYAEQPLVPIGGEKTPELAYPNRITRRPDGSYLLHSGHPDIESSWTELVIRPDDLQADFERFAPPSITDPSETKP